MIPKLIITLLKEILTDPKVIKEVLQFIKEMINKGYTREQVAYASVARYNLPLDTALKIIDFMLEKLDKK